MKQIEIFEGGCFLTLIIDGGSVRAELSSEPYGKGTSPVSLELPAVQPHTPDAPRFLGITDTGDQTGRIVTVTMNDPRACTGYAAVFRFFRKQPGHLEVLVRIRNYGLLGRSFTAGERHYRLSAGQSAEARVLSFTADAAE